MFGLVVALAAQALPTPAAATTRGDTAVVRRSAAGWEVTYRFRTTARGWVFPVSAPVRADHALWRPAAWRVLTPGVRIERHGAYDVLVPTRGRHVPATVRIAFAPTVATLDREYDPAIAFGTGAVALYTDQFDVAPVKAPAALDHAAPEQTLEALGGAPLPVKFHDEAGPVFVAGRRQADPVLTGAHGYVVFGAAEVETVGGVAMIADPALPAWLKADIAAFAPEVTAHYAARLGTRSDAALPLLMLAWRGATPGKVVNDGGVRPGQLLLNFEGEGLLDRNPRAARRTRWFLAHELAHFWLGTGGVAYRDPGDAWITEGGADMMALTLLAAGDHDDALAELQRAVGDCIALAPRPVAASSRAPYACGAVFALSAAGATRRAGGKDWFDFLRPLLAAHANDRRIGGADWMAHYAAVVRDPAASAAIATLLAGTPQAADAVAAVLRGGGIGFTRAGDTITLASDAI